MHEDQRVADMANEVLARQAQAHAKQTGEAFEDALESVLKTEAGRQLGKLRDGPHGGTMAAQWQEDLMRGRSQGRIQTALSGLAGAVQRPSEFPVYGALGNFP